MRNVVLILYFLIFSVPVFAQMNVETNTELSTVMQESSLTFDDQINEEEIQTSQASASGDSSAVSPEISLSRILMILMLGFMIFGFIVVLCCFPLFLIAQKTGVANAYFAFIPVLNYFLLCKISGRPVWWMVLYLVPFVNLIVDVLVWMDIAKLRNKPNWLGVLVIIPIINLGVMWYIALSDS